MTTLLVGSSNDAVVNGDLVFFTLDDMHFAMGRVHAHLFAERLLKALGDDA